MQLMFMVGDRAFDMAGGEDAVADLVPGAVFSISLPNTMTAASVGQDGMREFLQAHGVSTKRVYQAELVLEEVFTNAVRYAFDDGGHHDIHIEVGLLDEQIALQFVDDGKHFDPTVFETAPQPVSVEDAQIGGLGIKLLRQWSQSMTYRRDGERNLLRITLARA
jgi:anti-sigma regulatory factor (Ser/Thr protein kinase)